jgi:hypothetical protein
MFLTGLKHCVEFYKKFRNLFECIWYPNARVVKQIIKQKIRKETAQKKKREEEGTSPTGPHPRPKARQQPDTGRASPAPRTPFSPLFSLLFFFNTDGWDSPVIPNP